MANDEITNVDTAKKWKSRVDLIEKAVKMANWRDYLAGLAIFINPIPFEKQDVYSGQRNWFCNALMTLTREEIIYLYDNLMDSHKRSLKVPGDFTHPEAKKLLKHLYPDGTGVEVFKSKEQN